MYEEYLRDPAAVGAEWRRLFESGVVGERPENGRSGAPTDGRTGAQAQGGSAEAARLTDGTEVVRPGDRAPSRPSAPAGASPIKGPAAKLVANMTESLTVPTATTFRVVPVGTLEQKRKLLNQGLQTAGKSGKISFTHLIAFALVQATKQHPVMGHTLVAQDGAPYRVAPDGIGL